MKGSNVSLLENRRRPKVTGPLVAHLTEPVTGERTPVLAIVHAVLSGVVVLHQTPALGGVGFIRNERIGLGGHLGGRL